MDLVILINMFLSMVRNFVSEPVYNRIKQAADAAMNLPAGGDGERVNYMIGEAMKVAASTKTPVDDFAISLAAFLYLRKAQAKAKK